MTLGTKVYHNIYHLKSSTCDMQKRKDLTATEGHVVLLEYFEEFPMLLGHPGMGARLTTYYRRDSPTDTNYQRLLKGQLMANLLILLHLCY